MLPCLDIGAIVGSSEMRKVRSAFASRIDTLYPRVPQRKKASPIPPTSPCVGVCLFVCVWELRSADLTSLKTSGPPEDPIDPLPCGLILASPGLSAAAVGPRLTGSVDLVTHNVAAAPNRETFGYAMWLPLAIGTHLVMQCGCRSQSGDIWLCNVAAARNRETVGHAMWLPLAIGRIWGRPHCMTKCLPIASGSYIA